MSLSSVVSRVSYTGNGAVDTYSYTFKVFDQGDLLVTVKDLSDVETTLVIATDYTVTGVGETSGGNVALVNSSQAWLDAGGDLLTGFTLTIRRVSDLVQTTDIRNNGDFYPETHEDTFDKLVMLDQQQQDEIDRSVKLPETVSGSDFDATLPSDILDSADKVPAMNATGDGFAAVSDWPTVGAISTAAASAAAAAASAAAALVSEGLAQDWAQKTSGLVDAIDYSSKEYAQGTQVGTGGSSKDWAQKISSPVTGSEYSAREHATGTQSRGISLGGSAKDWANYTGGTVDDTEYSAKKYAQDAALAVVGAQWQDVSFATFASSPVAITDANVGTMYSCDCTAGNIVINLPSIASLTLSGPWSIGFKKTDSSANTVTINRDGTDLIDGATSIVISYQNQGAVLIPDVDPSPDYWTSVRFGDLSTLYSPQLNTPRTDVVTLDGQASSPSSPSAGDYKLFVSDTTQKLTLIDSAGSTTTVGSGSSGINYFSANPDAEAGVTGLTAYADSGAAPVDGTGGSPTLTITRTTSNPLRTTGSFLITHAASNQQGQGISYPVTIDRADRGQQLSISFDYEIASGTYATGDLGMYIVDVTNGTVIQPSGFQVVNVGINSRHAGCVFQAASNSTSYRICWHVATSTATAYTLAFDNVICGPQVVPVGAAMSDWTAYTPTGTWTTNTAYTGRWRRVGDSMEIDAQALLSGAPTGAFTLNIPSGFTIDSTKISAGGTLSLYGAAYALDAATANYTGTVLYSSSTAVQVVGDGAAGSLYSATVPFTFGNLDKVTLRFTVPILGWSSNTIVSDSAATRSVTLRVSGTPNSTITSATWGTVTWSSSSVIGKDDVGAMVATTGVYTVKVPGTYKWQANIEVARSSGSATEAIALRINRNSGAFFYYGARSNWTSGGSEANGNSASGQFEANAGDTISLQAYVQGSGLAWNSGLTGTNFQLQLDQGPAQIQAATVVAARYSTAAGQSIVSGGATVVWGTKDFDTTGSMNTGTGVYTAPAPGYYLIASQVCWESAAMTSAAAKSLQFYKNGALNHYILSYPSANLTTRYGIAGSTSMYLNAGETIAIFVACNEAGSRSLSTSGSENWVSISRLSGVN